MRRNFRLLIAAALTVLLAAAWRAVPAAAAPEDGAGAVKAFVGARVIDGTGKPPMQKATIVVRNGKIEAVGPSVKPPAGAQTIDASGKTIIPGLISAHSHVNTVDQLGIYARDGITTVWSLGGANEIAMRDQTRAEQGTAGLTRARLFIAGPIPTSKTPEDGRRAVDALATAKTEIVKFRLDDNLGRGSKMPPEVYSAIIDEAHKKGMRVAVHVVYLSDAKAVLKLGADYIAHSVRDFDIDDETIALLKKNNAFYCPTLTREVSTFVYGEKPAFLKDPMLIREANPAELAKVQDAKFDEDMRNDKVGAWYKEHLAVALRNVKKLQDAGVPVVMGTDSGAPTGRFQGYFEHMELEYMAKAGLTPMQILVDSTLNPARSLKMQDQIGTIEKGKWADLVILNANPLDDIRNTMKIESVWIAGNRVPAKN